MLPGHKSSQTNDTSELSAQESIAETSSNQDDVIRFLSDGGASGKVSDERIDTHISHVFLVGAFAWKLKRAVKLEFLDFTSLEARRLACEREVEINRRTAPEIYLGVSAITRCDHGLEFDGEGDVVDYIVKMNRFDDQTLFNRLNSQNDLNESLISDLAEQIAKFHLGADRRKGFGGTKSVEKTLQGLVLTLSRFDGSLFLKGSVSNWALKMETEVKRHAGSLDARRRAGFVRDCHGDLHLGNICLVNGRPTPFDAIEFGDDYSSIDVMYDLAFPVMDLVCARSPGLANLLLNRYLEMTGDYSGLQVFSLFMSLRAGVRAMVHALEFQSSRADSADKIAAQAYFDLADELLERSAPVLVAVGGVSGSGKSTLARALATSGFPCAGAIVLRSDAVRKHIFHHPALVPLPKDAYADRVNRRVFRMLCRDAHRALTSGYSVMVDATFLNEKRRDQIESVAEKRRVPFCGLWLDAEKEVVIDRVAARASDVSDANKQVICEQLEKGAGDVTWTRIKADLPPPHVLSSAQTALKSCFDAETIPGVVSSLPPPSVNSTSSSMR